VCSESIFSGVIRDEFRPVFTPARISDRRFNAAGLKFCFVTDLVPENFGRIGRDLMEMTAGIVGVVFDRRVAATKQNGGDTYREQLWNERAHCCRRYLLSVIRYFEKRKAEALKANTSDE